MKNEKRVRRDEQCTGIGRRIHMMISRQFLAWASYYSGTLVHGPCFGAVKTRINIVTIPSSKTYTLDPADSCLCSGFDLLNNLAYMGMITNNGMHNTSKRRKDLPLNTFVAEGC